MDRQERLRRRRELYRLSRRAEETPQEREVRLARRRERERVRRATLSAERRQSILDQRRERYQHSCNLNAGPTSDNPIEVTVRAVDDHDVIQKMKQFHEELTCSLGYWMDPSLPFSQMMIKRATTCKVQN